MSKKATVSLGSAIDITQVSSLKTRLVAAVDKSLPVVLIADKVEKADTAGLQLVYAFIKNVENNGHSVSWQKPSDSLVQSSEILGMRELLYLV